MKLQFKDKRNTRPESIKGNSIKEKDSKQWVTHIFKEVNRKDNLNKIAIQLIFLKNMCLIYLDVWEKPSVHLLHLWNDKRAATAYKNDRHLPHYNGANPSHFYFMILIYAKITTLFCIKFCFNEFFKYTSLHI